MFLTNFGVMPSGGSCAWSYVLFYEGSCQFRDAGHRAHNTESSCNAFSDDAIQNYISLVGLNPKDKKHVDKYSLGMRQRLGIAQAIKALW